MKRDYLKECMSDAGNPPLDKFQIAWCVHCQNAECVRNGGKNFKFNKRVDSWKEDLFESPPRATEEDPRFNDIRLKRFVPVSGGKTYELRSSREVPFISTPAVKEPEKVVTNPPSMPSRFQIDEGNPTTEDLVIQEPALVAPVQSAPINSHVADLVNTKFTQGAVLPGEKQESGDKVESPGSTFTFDND